MAPAAIARRLAEWSSALRHDDLPPAVQRAAPALLLDYLGNAIGGARGASSQAMARFAEAHAPRGEATVIARGEALHPAYAALLNGQSAHVLESDDTHQESSSHPGASVWSAVLAVGETTGATLGDAIAAAAIGYDVVGRLGAALGAAEHYARGFHPTGTCGAFGCAAAVARLLRLDAERTMRALGIAASQAAGSMEFLADGSWTKRLHPGWAAHSGITAAELAAAGFTGPESALEGASGFLAAHSASPRPERILEHLGEDFELARTSIKAHACCRYKQGPIDALLALRREHGLAPADVEAVTVGMLAAGFDIVAEPRAKKAAPRSVVDAQFSMAFGAAVALVCGRASIHEYAEPRLEDPAVLAVAERVRCVRDPALDARFPRQWPAWVEVRTRDGRALRATVDHPKGDPENPLSWPEVVAKLEDLAGDALAGDRLAAIAAQLADPDPARPLRELTRLLRG